MAKSPAPQPDEELPVEGAAENIAEGDHFAALPLAEILQRLYSSGDDRSTSDATAILATIGPNQIDSAKPNALCLFPKREGCPL